MTERVIAIVAHPDDETLGCGATLAKHAQRGDPVSVFAMADGASSRVGMNADAIKQRHSMFRRACAILGTEDVWLRAFYDNRMDKYPLLEIVQTIEEHIARFKPTIVYTHWHGDMNVDHQVVSRATLTACRPLPGSSVKRLLMFEVPSSTEWGAKFEPTWFEDVSDTMSFKREAWRCYETEMREYPHPRSVGAISSLAQWRGATAGLQAAEAFAVARIIA